MKKSTIALSVVIALGVIWTGGAYYTGIKAEQEIQYQIDKTNEQFAISNKLSNAQHFPQELKLEKVKFDRGIFTSEFAYNVQVNQNGQQTNIPFSGTLYHGPLPLNLVKKFNFIPAMFSADLEVTKDSNTEKWFIDGKNPFVNEFTMTYSQRMKGSYSYFFKALNLGEFSLTADSQGEYDLDRDGKNGEFNATFKQLEIAPNTDDLVISIKDATTNLKIGKENKELPYIYDSNYEIKVDSLTMTSVSNDLNLKVKDLNVGLSSYLKDNNVDLDLKYSLGSLIDGEQDIGAVQFNALANHLDAKSVNSLIDEFLKFERPFDSSNSVVSLSTLAIMQNQPQFKIENLNLNRKSGSLKADVDIALAKLDPRNLDPRKFLSLFKTLTVNATLDKSLAKEMLAAKYIEQNMIAEQANQRAEKDLSDFISFAKSNDLIKEEGDILKLNTHLDGENLDLNGRKVTSKELEVLMMFM